MKSNSNSIVDKNNRLGRGLDVLLGPSIQGDQILLLDIEKIYPNKQQPRTAFNKESFRGTLRFYKDKRSFAGDFSPKT